MVKSRCTNALCCQCRLHGAEEGKGGEGLAITTGILNTQVREDPAGAGLGCRCSKPFGAVAV